VRAHNRCVEFEFLERLTLLSSVHPAMGHESDAAHAAAIKLPAYVRAVEQLAKSHGSHVTVRVLIAPGTSTEYEITFQAKGKTYTTDIVIPVPPTSGPQPG
jgi:hypothetical protein